MNKIAKQENTFKGYARTYNVETLNTFNSEVQPKDTESAIKTKLVELLAQVKGFKFVTTLVLLFKPIESKGKKKKWQFLFKLKSRINKNQ